MTYTSNVTQKGQITLPKAIRNKLNIKPNKKVLIELVDDHIVIRSSKDLLAVAGFLKDKIKVEHKDILLARDSFEETYERI